MAQVLTQFFFYFHHVPEHSFLDMLLQKYILKYIYSYSNTRIDIYTVCVFVCVCGFFQALWERKR